MQPTTADAMIRCWRIARLSSDSGNLGYPKINIIARCALYGGGLRASAFTAQFIPMQSQKDADMVQKIVVKMPHEMKVVFEAKHLGLINGKKMRHIPHKQRARALGIGHGTYWRRLDSGTKFVTDWLAYEFDKWDSNCQNRVLVKADFKAHATAQ